MSPDARGAAPGLLSLAERHPQAVALGLGVVGTSLAVGPLTFAVVFYLPMWLLAAPLALSLGSFVAAAGISRGVLTRYLRAQRQPQLERRLLALAARAGGQLTVPATAHHLSISLAEADELLTSLARQDYVDIENDLQTGELIYVFPNVALMSPSTDENFK